MFVDRIKLKLIAGKGGNGVVAFRREKYIPKGGPYGGNGGKGGAVILKASAQLMSLEHLKGQYHLQAENGRVGGSNRCQGRAGKDLIVLVPVGTQVKSHEGYLLVDLSKEGQESTLCRGGRGGRGNASFATAKNRAPNYATLGTPGEECLVELELKIIADIGLVGFPNAGKSTLISQLSQAKVKIAPYPFTTLHPNLGVLEFEKGARTIIADIPGIIEGASANRGLGLEFLRHVERTKIIVFVLDVSGIDGRSPLQDFQVLMQELKSYDVTLLNKPHLIVLNKIDEESASKNIQDFYEGVSSREYRVIEISAKHQLHLDRLKEYLYDVIFES